MIQLFLPDVYRKTFATLALATVMAGCANYLNPGSTSSEPRVRAVEIPNDLASPLTEAVAPVPAVILAGVDLPNHGGETTRVHTIVEPLVAPAVPTIQAPPPMTQPVPSIIIQSASTQNEKANSAVSRPK